jgi:hypothetical protein
MDEIPQPTLPADDPDRFLKCQDAVHIAFQDLADRAVAAGWGEQEVAAALVDVADNHTLMLAANGEADFLINFLKKPS